MGLGFCSLFKWSPPTIHEPIKAGPVIKSSICRSYLPPFLFSLCVSVIPVVCGTSTSSTGKRNRRGELQITALGIESASPPRRPTTFRDKALVYWFIRAALKNTSRMRAEEYFMSSRGSSMQPGSRYVGRHICFVQPLTHLCWNLVCIMMELFQPKFHQHQHFRKSGF